MSDAVDSGSGGPVDRPSDRSWGPCATSSAASLVAVRPVGPAEARLTTDDVVRLRSAIETERRRTAGRIDGLERSFAGIVESSEGTATDDEHDPEGATIAYERAQVWALLLHAREDLLALDVALERLDSGTITTCSVCGGPIALARLMAQPQGRTCIRCAS